MEVGALLSRDHAALLDQVQLAGEVTLVTDDLLLVQVGADSPPHQLTQPVASDALEEAHIVDAKVDERRVAFVQLWRHDTQLLLDDCLRHPPQHGRRRCADRAHTPTAVCRQQLARPKVVERAVLARDPLAATRRLDRRDD